MKRAVIAGLNSSGVDCRDLELMPLPITRFTVRSRQAAGGVSVRTSPDDPEVVEIRLFDADGADLQESTQRMIERIFFREDYRRAGPRHLGELEFPSHVPEQYVSGLLRTLDLAAIRAAQLKVVVDYAFGPLSLLGPSVMGRLGCDMLSVNAFIDEHRPVLAAPDVELLIAKLAEHVRNSGSDLGVLLEPGGEIAHLVDDRGRAVDDVDALLAFLRHEAERGSPTVALPVSAPSVSERIAASFGTTVAWCATSPTALMSAASEPDVGFAGDAEGTLLWPGFIPAPDGLMTFCKALEMVAEAGQPLSEIVDGVPDSFVVQRDEPTPWNLKGAVMRYIPDHAGPGERVLVDGVKIVEGDRWALVVPYPDAPACRIWAEAPTLAESEALADRYAAMVSRVVEHPVDE